MSISRPTSRFDPKMRILLMIFVFLVPHARPPLPAPESRVAALQNETDCLAADASERGAAVEPRHCGRFPFGTRQGYFSMALAATTDKGILIKSGTHGFLGFD